MDRNTVIGFTLLAVLLFAYLFFNRQGQMTYENQQKHIQDSIAALRPKPDTIPLSKANSATNQIQDSAQIQNEIASIQNDTIENNLIKIIFTNKGAQPEKVILKKFKTFDGLPLVISDSGYNDISYAINIGPNRTAQTDELFFASPKIASGQAGAVSIQYELKTQQGQSIIHEYTLKPDEYMVDFAMRLNGVSQLISSNTINLLWKARATKMEKDMEWETQQSHVSYVENGSYDFEHLAAGKEDTKKLEKPVEWVALNQQFFVKSIGAASGISSADLQFSSPKDTASHIIADAHATLHYPLSGNDATVALKLYYGPSDYKILKSFNNQMSDMVPLGSGIFAFVKYINRGFIMPVFNFLVAHIKSFGLIIALMTIVIRLLISPLTYQSYLSGAKMKLLKPEIELLKAKYGDDKQAFGMDQMKLFRSAGVNPLGGCIPALLQIPIFFALYNFFNSNITLRGQSFLWAKDLSSYDSIYNLPFNIPFYGNHVSLFTIFAVITSLLISIYGMSNMQDNSNPVMKYLPFIFPVILLGFFNKLPAALTWYYTVSNVITLLIQFVIQKYIIDHDKIMARLQENKKKPVTKSKWQERITAMQESNEKLKSMKQKTETPRRK